jgi:hypothetical protein
MERISSSASRSATLMNVRPNSVVPPMMDMRPMSDQARRCVAVDAVDGD